MIQYLIYGKSLLSIFIYNKIIIILIINNYNFKHKNKIL